MADDVQVSENFNSELSSETPQASPEQWKDYFSNYSKEQLLHYVKNYSLEDHLSEASAVLKYIKSQFDHITEQETESALQRFLANGSEAADFEFRKDDVSVEFEKIYFKIKDQFQHQLQQLEKQKLSNLEKKKSILEQMRTLLAGEESAESHKQFRSLQDAWKQTGPVPTANNKDLWSNYQALTDMYYNRRSMYFELKELDRKKNLELKKQILSKVEALLDSPSVNKAFTELRKLQEEFRAIGPVPKEEADKLWNQMKSSIDALNEKRKQFFDDLSVQKKNNLVQKELLIAKIKSLEDFMSDKIDEWKVQSDFLLSIQEEWKKIGPVPEEQIKESTKQFWTSAKKFFANKSQFFKELDAKRKENLDKKVALCEQAEALQSNTDFAATSKKLMNLQNEWKKIGQVPIKYKDSIYQRFKKACDTFFDQQRQSLHAAEEALHLNAKEKETFITSLENKVADGREVVLSWLEEWGKLGETPAEKKKELSERFKSVLQQAVDKLEDITEEKEKLQLHIEVKLAGAKRMEGVLKELQKKAGALKADIDRYKTNMDFLANSPKAESLKADVRKKIEEADEELKKLTDKINILKKY
ncbi:MAG: DUF349 domain-containing protein [Cytophagaceae bacterium]|jgi:hypothetical protein|nr:DUF349 domain-containing protein [Cytophagaceae bacterium]